MLPQPVTLLRRPSLFARLDQARTAVLTLVAAPAGFGKTSLLQAWANQSTAPTVWLTLGSKDNALVYFGARLIRAFQTVGADRGVSTPTHHDQPSAHRQALGGQAPQSAGRCGEFGHTNDRVYRSRNHRRPAAAELNYWAVGLNCVPYVQLAFIMKMPQS